MSRRRRNKREHGRRDFISNIDSQILNEMLPDPVPKLVSPLDRVEFHDDLDPITLLPESLTGVINDPSENRETSGRQNSGVQKGTLDPLREMFKGSIGTPASVGRTPKHDPCTRRSERTEVLHALKKTGSGKGKQKPPIWTKDSKIKC